MTVQSRNGEHRSFKAYQYFNTRSIYRRAFSRYSYQAYPQLYHQNQSRKIFQFGARQQHKKCTAIRLGDYIYISS